MKYLRELLVVQWVVYVFFRAFTAAVEMFPDRRARKIGILLGRLAHFLDRRHRRFAETNLRAAQPPVCPPDRIPRLIRRLYEHIGLSVIEMLQTPRLVTSGRIRGIVKLERWELFRQEMAAGRGGLCIIAHLGNWEIGGVAVTMAGYPLNSLARPIENRFLDRYLNRFRTLTGQRIIPKYNALRAMMQTIRNNQILVIQADQDARGSGVFPNFFGRPASTVRSPAILSLRFNIPLIICEIFRENGKHVVRLHDPIDPAPFRDRPDAVEALTQSFTSKLEECIRRHPEQWTWMHRRWKTKAEDGTAVEKSEVEPAAAS